MRQRDGWMSILIFLVVALGILCVVLGAMLLWMARQNISEGEQDYFDANIGRLRRSLKGIPKPRLDSMELAALLKEDGCIRSREVYDMARWYVYHANEDVIRQLIANLANEVELRLPEETHSTLITSNWRCGYIAPLVGFCPSPKHLGRILHRELLGYSADSKTDPHLIYLIMECIHDNDKNDDYWRSRHFFCDDMLAYIRIYANYKEWPTVTEYAARAIRMYPSDWFDNDTMNEVLQLARREDSEAAYGLYMQRFRGNHHTALGYLADLNDPNTFYEADATFQGWCSEDVRGTTRVYDVTSGTAVAGIPYVQKIVQVLRDGADITSQCVLTPENVMKVPLKAGKVVDLEYKVHVTHAWSPRVVLSTGPEMTLDEIKELAAAELARQDQNNPASTWSESEQ